MIRYFHDDYPYHFLCEMFATTTTRMLHRRAAASGAGNGAAARSSSCQPPRRSSSSSSNYTTTHAAVSSCVVRRRRRFVLIATRSSASDRSDEPPPSTNNKTNTNEQSTISSTTTTSSTSSDAEDVARRAQTATMSASSTAAVDADADDAFHSSPPVSADVHRKLIHRLGMPTKPREKRANAEEMARRIIQRAEQDHLRREGGRAVEKAAAATEKAVEKAVAEKVEGSKAERATMVKDRREEEQQKKKKTLLLRQQRAQEYEAEKEKRKDEFDFFQQWWPLQATIDLPHDRSTRIELLGTPLVIWHVGEHAIKSEGADHAHGFRVFVDACPHRLAPLSEGRVEDNRSPDAHAATPKTKTRLVTELIQRNIPFKADELTEELENVTHDKPLPEKVLACAYHGWQFDGSGSCVFIPQAENFDKKALAERESATSLVAHVTHDGLLWVWAAPLSRDEATAKMPPPGPPPDAFRGVRDKKKWTHTRHYFRELPYYGWEALVENICDPAHVPFAHHGTQGRREMAQPIRMKRDDMYDDARVAPSQTTTFDEEDDLDGKRSLGYAVGTSPGKAGYGVAVAYQASAAGATMHTSFRPSRGGLVLYELDVDAPATPIRLVVHCIPVAPFKSRTIFTVYSAAPQRPQEEAPAKKKKRDATTTVPPPPPLSKRVAFAVFRLVQALQRKMPWWDHLVRNSVFDGDAAFLHAQERLLDTKRNRGADWRAAYHMPTSSDMLVIAFRTWLDRFTANSGGPPYMSARFGAYSTKTVAAPTLASATLFPPKKDLLDRWEQHTKHCKTCRRAHAVAGTLSRVFEMLTLLLACATVSLMVVLWSYGVEPFVLSGVTLSATCVTFVSSRLQKLAHELRGRFEFRDYVHQDRE